MDFNKLDDCYTSVKGGKVERLNYRRTFFQALSNESMSIKKLNKPIIKTPLSL